MCTDDYFMNIALEEAKQAFQGDEIPVGAVIVKGDRIISRAHNMKEELKDPTAHAEILSIREACRVLDNWRLTECRMYVTVEPCAMCASAICQSRIAKIYIGTFNEKCGACGSVANFMDFGFMDGFTEVKWMYHSGCENIMVDFFKKRRYKPSSQST
ncbi:tRNA-adenosine deaminase [Hathewaya proteolytica DSM 3090]|uniref:tRNA-specific adenosine deaminase n=1 Tax=Hathewaya proteolytica DSM 3090 TaxID=1121331 RepID=A0A1M6SCK3_9CLOT|nr:nucleoside deaminase [Hathewaya proteolytica]SHK42267.1 tRNA-adenosine deaminase [Hathewaya proteolytica DSM 3090]